MIEADDLGCCDFVEGHFEDDGAGQFPADAFEEFDLANLQFEFFTLPFLLEGGRQEQGGALVEDVAELLVVFAEEFELDGFVVITQLEDAPAVAVLGDQVTGTNDHSRQFYRTAAILLRTQVRQPAGDVVFDLDLVAVQRMAGDVDASDVFFPGELLGE